MRGLPPAAGPKILSFEEREKNRRARRVQGHYCAGELEARQNGTYVEPPLGDHLVTEGFTKRPPNGRMRGLDGRFVRDPVPNHKRVPPIVPHNKGKTFNKKTRTYVPR